MSGDGSLSPPRPEGCLSSAYSQSGERIGSRALQPASCRQPWPRTGHTVWQLVAGDFCGGGRSLLFGSVNVGKHNPVFIRGKADAFANVEIEAGHERQYR